MDIVSLVLIGFAVYLLVKAVKRTRTGAVRGCGSARGMGETMYYRTKDSLADYRFQFRQMCDGTYRIHILEQPSYCGRNESAHVTHRLSDGGHRYICWKGKLRTLQDAKRVAAIWADETQAYIKFGGRF